MSTIMALAPLLSRRLAAPAAASRFVTWRASSPALCLAPARSVVTIKKFTADRARRVPTTLSKASATASQSSSGADGPAATGNAVRLAKRIAMSGLCSRREAEKLILQRQVTVNGQVAEDVGTNVSVTDDVVSVDGKPLARVVDRKDGKARHVKVWMAHKLAGELVTASDPQGRATIFDRLRVMGLTQHMMPVGRLDFNTEGLLLFTNDGDYARQLEHPKSEVPRVYRALVRGNVSESKLLELRRGPTVDGIKYRSIYASVQSTDKKDSWLQIRIAEGKNREVRKALAHVRLVVKRLVRVQFGPFRLADLPAGAVLEVRPKALAAVAARPVKASKAADE